MVNSISNMFLFIMSYNGLKQVYLLRTWFSSGCLGKYCRRWKLRKNVDSFSFAILKNYFFRCDCLLKFYLKDLVQSFNIGKN